MEVLLTSFSVVSVLNHFLYDSTEALCRSCCSAVGVGKSRRLHVVFFSLQYFRFRENEISLCSFVDFTADENDILNPDFLSIECSIQVKGTKYIKLCS